MSRFAVAGGIASISLFLLGLAPSAAGAFSQCPPVGADTGCQFLITITDSATSLQNDTTQGPYESIEDALIGVQNNSSKAVSAIPLSSPNSSLFGFENDGLCNPGSNGPAPAGCQPPPGSSGITCNPSASQGNNCSFPPPPGEPASYMEPGGFTGSTPWPNGDIQNGYEGPTSWFSFVSTDTSSGVVNFSPPLAPGASTYFSLESPPGGQLNVGNNTVTRTTLSGGGQSGASIAVAQGTAVTDSATATGPSAANAGGTVTYNIFTDVACKTPPVGNAGTKPVVNGAGGASNPIATLPPGTYYWQASYSGDSQNQGSMSACASEVLKILSPTTTTTTQTGGKITAPTLTVPSGTPVTDQAKISGPSAASATGTVTYVVFRDRGCTVRVPPPSSAAVVNGVAGKSAAVTLATGTYYWTAAYSGDARNAPSVSACGAEKLVVPGTRSQGIPKNVGCGSKRFIIIHPRIPKGAKLLSAYVFINGRLTKRIQFGKKVSFVNLKGLPKGTFVIAIIVTTKDGRNFQDHRKYHTCVNGRRK